MPQRPSDSGDLSDRVDLGQTPRPQSRNSLVGGGASPRAWRRRPTGCGFQVWGNAVEAGNAEARRLSQLRNENVNDNLNEKSCH